MHKRLFNQAKIVVDISPVTPLLIKSGGESADPSLPHMNFVRTYNPIKGETVYIPGSSFKGVVRSYSEKILRSLNIPCCNPLCNEIWDGEFEGNCGKGRKNINDEEPPQNTKKGAGALLYKNWTCFACKMYGSTNIASRVHITDGHPQNGFTTAKRTGVAIDRILGSALGGGLFDCEVVTSGTFRIEIFLANFQLWQMGLIGLTLRDINEGYVQLGFAKSRGLGRVSAKAMDIDINYIIPPSVENQIWGMGMDEGEGGRLAKDEYGFLEDDYINIDTKIDTKPETQGLRTRYKIEAGLLFEKIVSQDSPCWRAFLAQCIKHV